MIKLPFKQSIENLGESHTKVLQLAMKLRNQFEINANYAHAYSDFLNEHERLQHMQLVLNGQSPTSYGYYLPHHGILREQSLRSLRS